MLMEMRYVLLASGTHYTLKQSCIYYDTYNDTSLSSTVDQGMSSVARTFLCTPKLLTNTSIYYTLVLNNRQKEIASVCNQEEEHLPLAI